MIDGLRTRVRTPLERVHRVERREVKEFRDWIENTHNLTHVSVLVFLPLLIALVTYLSNAVEILPFLLFPPLASGTYTLFAHPESKYASPRRFVGGLTAGAVCGWVALEVTLLFQHGFGALPIGVGPGGASFGAVHPGAAAFGVFLTGAVTWALDIEESSAFSTALLVLVTGVTQLVYLAGVVLSTAIIAGAFVFWRSHFYEQRARYLYQSTSADDRVLVPMRGATPEKSALLGARLAAAHDAGKVVLLDVVDDREVTKAERARSGSKPTVAEDGQSDSSDTFPHAADGHDAASGPKPALDATSESERRAGEAAVVRVKERAAWIRARVDVPCEVLVAATDGASQAETVLQAAEEAGCDLVVAPYDPDDGRLSPFLRELLGGDVDVVVHRSSGREEWNRVLVPVRRVGDVAHAMIDFALRLSDDGQVGVCHCITSKRQRREAEEMLANVVETFDGHLETRVAHEPIESFLERAAPGYDLVFLGASTDRSAASRFVSRPTFQRVEELDCDVAIVHRA